MVLRYARLRTVKAEVVDAAVTQIDRAIDHNQVLETLDLSKSLPNPLALKPLIDSFHALWRHKYREPPSPFFRVCIYLFLLIEFVRLVLFVHPPTAVTPCT